MDTLDAQTISYLKAGASLVIVLCLMLGMAAAFKYFTGTAYGPISALKKRLSIKEIKTIDHRHKLVIVARENTRHLIVLSSHSQPVVIETFLSSETEQQKNDIIESKDKNNASYSS